MGKTHRAKKPGGSSRGASDGSTAKPASTKRAAAASGKNGGEFVRLRRADTARRGGGVMVTKAGRKSRKAGLSKGSLEKRFYMMLTVTFLALP
jgi:hypothetical protein